MANKPTPPPPPAKDTTGPTMEWLRDHLLAVNLAPILKKMDAMGIKQMVIARGHGIVLQLTPAMGGKCIELPESLFTPPPPPR